MRYLGKNVAEAENTWVARDAPDLCDEGRDLKKKQYEEEGPKEYRKAKKGVKRSEESESNSRHLALV